MGDAEDGAAASTRGGDTASSGAAEAEHAESDAAASSGRGDAGTGESDEGAAAVPISGTRAERYQVLLLTRPEALRQGAEGGAHLEDGTRLSRETARRLCCDAAAVRVTRDSVGSVLDVGRRTRTIPPALRRALELRDGGCRFPGCGLRFTDGHHLVHWADGGQTALDNLILLCRHHHRLLHEGGWTVQWAGRTTERSRRGPRRLPLFVDPRGRFHAEPGHRGLVRDGNGGIPGGRGPVRGGGAPTRSNGAPGRIDGATDAAASKGEGSPDADGLIGGPDAAPAPDPWGLHADYERIDDVPWTLRARAREALDEAHSGG